MKSTYTGKVIEIKRQFNQLALAQTDPEVQEWFGQSFRAIGPYNEETGVIATGLDFDEQKLLLPGFIGIEASDKDFRTAVTRRYHEFLTRVPRMGIKLQISLEDDSLPLSATNMPRNITDYLTYRHVINHPEVAVDQATAERYQNKKFYVYDGTQINKEAMSISVLEDTATMIYMKYKDDQIKIDQILTVMGVSIRSLKGDKKTLAFKSLSKTDDKYNDYEQKEAFEKFIRIAEDKDLEYRYLIQEMIGAQYLKRVGTVIHLTESGEPIGQDMEAAIMFYKNPKNSRDLNLLKAQYLVKIKKDENYLPKEAKASKKVEVTDKTE